MDTNRIDLNLLRVFHAILEEHNLTLAANRLGLSQPAVSYSLGRLRAILDDPLFVRNGNEMQPTSAALEMREPLREAMAAAEHALQLMVPFAAATSTRVFRLSMSDIGELAFLPTLCAALAECAPHVRLDIQSIPVDQIEDALRVGRLDLAIGNLPALVERTRHQRLFHEDYVCMTRRRRGLPRRTLTLEQYLAFPHVLVGSLESAHYQIEESFRKRNIHRQIALRVPHFTVVPHILAHTDWIVTLPRRTVRLLNPADEFAVYDLPVDIAGVTVTVHWHADFDTHDANRWLRTLVITQLSDAPA
ncbi:LysR family regulatory protein [Paraburkholderia ribeironis]|uniref:LysR family regulatory protein n=1 Tax=Paraburkholderia ribeironis TaxID=1247936 RepID=A0A1N7RQR6_9BURK|nr:LysR family transcriptional regulator [Paraburkholderia ribeironis]SIT37467.1 LysR family regulatory protein [Paraburkholderia ribeironis]